MENQKLNDQLQAIKKLNKENYDNIRKQVFLLSEALKTNYSRPEGVNGAKEKEYTILSFISTDCDAVFNKQHNDTYVNTCVAHSLEDCLRYNTFKIHSVRREKDGEVFTLGDKVFFLSDSNNIKEIEAITINHAFISKLSVSVGGIEKWGMNNLQKAPIRKPILITEDKVEIFEEGVVNYVSSDWTEGEVKLNRAVDEEAKPNFKFYSTEKAAQEYIKWNKPMYSLKDIDEAASPSRTDMFKKLIDLNRK